MALRELLDHAPWPTWEPGLRDRDPQRVAEALAPHADGCEDAALRAVGVRRAVGASSGTYAAATGRADLRRPADLRLPRQRRRLGVPGAVPARRGGPADHRDRGARPTTSPRTGSGGTTRTTTGTAMAADGFAWWRRRIARQRELFDLVRIDHFRGFEAAWHVPVEAPTAKDGYWVTGPGREVLAALVETAGPGTLVAEDLGVITPEVEELRTAFGLPGMKVLQFAFDGGSDNAYLPRAPRRAERRLHRHPRQRHHARVVVRRSTSRPARGSGPAARPLTSRCRGR